LLILFDKDITFQYYYFTEKLVSEGG